MCGAVVALGSVAAAGGSDAHHPVRAGRVAQTDARRKRDRRGLVEVAVRIRGRADGGPVSGAHADLDAGGRDGPRDVLERGPGERERGRRAACDVTREAGLLRGIVGRRVAGEHVRGDARGGTGGRYERARPGEGGDHRRRVGGGRVAVRRIGKRDHTAVLDAAWNGWTASTPDPDLAQAPMFWDSRARSLESQAREPLTGETEMRGPSFDETSISPERVQRLTAIPEYVARFDAAFGSKTIGDTSIVRAIATFERTLVTVPSYQRGLAGEAGAISDAAKRGVAEFRDSGCSRCHSGPMLSDFSLHRFTQGGEAIRTASLRNVLRTAPYMHDGRATTLDQVFGIYRRIDQRADPLFRDLRVPDDGERAAVVAFLQSASDGDFDQSVPAEVPSGLAVGGTPHAGAQRTPAP
jgi:cytochrome c peroxidase